MRRTTSPTSPRSRGRTCCSSCARATPCRRCCSSSSRRSSSSTSRSRPARSTLAAQGLLWVAIVFTALLGLTRAFVAEREQRLIDGLVLAPCDRSAIWLAKSLAVLAFLVRRRARRAARLRALLLRGSTARTIAGVALADLGICAVGTLLAAMAVAGRARELLLPLLFLPLAIPIIVGGVGASVTDDPGRYLGFLALYDAIFAIISLGFL